MAQLQDGRYRAKARAWALAEAKTGTPEIAVEFVFSDPEMKGYSMTWHGYLTDGAFARTIESLRHCGWTGDDLENITGLDANEVELVVESEEWEGRMIPKVRWVNRAGGLAVTQRMTGDKAKAFAANMRGKIRALDAAKASGKPTPPPGTPGSEPINPDDIPF